MENGSATYKTFPNWMGELPDRLRSESLKNIAIPGSHNSFSFFLDCKSPVAPGSPKILKDMIDFLSKNIAVAVNMAKKIIHRWSVTQALNFKQQLDLGIRYFDFRISPWPGKEGFYFEHGLYGLLVSDGLREINDWLNEHPREVVIIDCNHLYDMQAKDHDGLISCIEEAFSSKLCPEMDLEGVTLNVLSDEGWQVITIYQHDEISAKHTNIWRKCTSIKSKWPDTDEPLKMMTELNDDLTTGRPPDMFYVSQGILTPTVNTILQHIGSNLKDEFALTAIMQTKIFLKDKTSGPTGINIVIADFVEMEQFVEAVLALNSKE
ncbi:PI-PLC X domain-containing protein 3-like [Strongylocentrotus purpuratus]|uniref:Phosphatidylinositol-specific phospholipase C X domain-containing protein n=1 Tax=Strongylocentrotus purpuratus TaxID=7668 RepID=A0A7M7RGN7_STRPU|nr:PI-PLC X domain-containing protein 3-like [Strongylocentrotus purpuratus]|eukprot:XP_791466.2 PREDICTED: PI-PLC X domain-containing protein 3-like [Strongylocentrotus purpuratus]